MYKFNRNIAERCGVNAAIVAQLIWDSIETSNYDGYSYFHDEMRWCRCSVQMMTGIFPFLSHHMIKDALSVLIKKKIIEKGCFNESKFDRTNWYVFTELGNYIMTGGGSDEGFEDYE